jgi:hypothetical protein
MILWMLNDYHISAVCHSCHSAKFFEKTALAATTAPSPPSRTTESLRGGEDAGGRKPMSGTDLKNQYAQCHPCVKATGWSLGLGLITAILRA